MSRKADVQLQAQNLAAAIQAKIGQGLALHQQGNLAGAERIYREVLQKQPDHFDALHMLGVIALQTQHLERAVELIGKAIALKPDFATAHYNRGNALRGLKHIEDALASYDKAVSLKPDYAEAYNNRGLALQDLKRHEEALASHDKAIALRPDYAEAYVNRGAALRKLKRLEDALASYDRAIALEPDFAMAHNNRANTLVDLCLPVEAIASCDKAIALNPDLAIPYYNRGNALRDLMRCAEALASYDKSIALNPDIADAYWSKSLCLLLLGDFEQGWRMYEWSRKSAGTVAPRRIPQPLWLGEEDIAGKTLFIWFEGGLGDTIQFCRYGKLAEARGAKVIMSVQRPLCELLKQSSPTIQIIGPYEVPIHFDYHCPLLSLPLAFNTTLSNIPADIPYLKGSEGKARLWSEKLGEKIKPRVGLVWSGEFKPEPHLWRVNKWRNIPLSRLAALKHPDIEFYSIQKGQPAESELGDLIGRHWDGPNIIDFTGQLNNFSDTAALIDNLDLVISVETSTAHLAGAMGKPVWILNPFNTDWRWLLDRTDSPWYPTVKLYRQEKAGDWDGVVQRVKSDLLNMNSSR